MNLAQLLRTYTALLLASASLWAQEDPAKRTFGNGILPEYLAVYDVNNDGRLSTEEAQTLRADRHRGKRHETFRRKWDSNRDGKISATEREAAKRTIRQLIIERRNRRFAEVDTNEDGFLTLREFEQIAAVQSVNATKPGTSTDIFKHLDHNEDSLISAEEFLRSLEAVTPQVENTKPKPHPDVNTKAP